MARPGKQAELPEKDFLEMARRYGTAEVARRLNINERNVRKRKARLETKLGVRLQAPSQNYGLFPHRTYPQRAIVEINKGYIIVASDAHYWPGEPGLMHRALVRLCKELKPSTVILNGDVIDATTISNYPPIGWENRPNLVEEIEAAQDRVSEIEKAAGRGRKIWTLGNHDCLDLETECLTKRGWKKYTEILPTDLVLSKDGDKALWSNINEIVSFPYDGELICIDKLRYSMAVTPNHRVLLKKNVYAGNYKYVRKELYYQAGSLPASFDIPMTACVDNPEAKLTDDQLILAGWILTDGHFGKHSTSIFQSKEKGKTSIRNLLVKLDLPFTEHKRDRKATSCLGRPAVKKYLPESHFYIKAAGNHWIRSWLPPKKRLPDWAYELSGRQFSILLDAIVAGDGTWDGPHPDGKKLCVIYGTKPFLEDIQAAAVAHGWRSRFYVDNRGAFRLWLSRNQNIRIERKEVTTRKYKGEVWCLRVPLGNFMVRRSGTAYFTGNSRFEKRLAVVAREYAKLHGVHLQDHFPLWEPAWSVWINDEVVVKHRYKGGIHAPYNNTVMAGKSIITGHLHSAKVIPFDDYNGTRYGVDSGCIAEPYGPQFTDYTEDSPKNWRSAFVVLTFVDKRMLQPELVLKWDDKRVQFRGEIFAP